MAAYDAPMQTEADRPAAAVHRPTEHRSDSAAALIGTIADWFTIAGMFFVPIYVPNIGGVFGLVAADVILAFAVMGRVLHLAVAGVSAKALQRQSFLLGVFGLFTLAGAIAQVVNHQHLLAWGYVRLVLGTGGAIILVATFGGDDWEANRLRLVRAMGLGFAVLSLSSFVGPDAGGRPFGWSIHPNALGHSCVMGFFVAVWLVDHATSRNAKLFWGFAILTNFYAVMQSGSRGGFLGLAAGGVFYLALRGSRRAFLTAVALVWVAVLALGAGLVQLPANNPINRLLNEETGSGLSNEERRGLLEEDLEFIAESPVFGQGFQDDERIINVHVVYLQGWVAAGATAGFCLMLIGVTMVFLPIITPRRDVALACGAAAIAVAWLFTNILSLRDQWLYIALAFGSARSISVLRPRELRGDPASDPP
jgi:hypothetical protein